MQIPSLILWIAINFPEALICIFINQNKNFHMIMALLILTNVKNVNRYYGWLLSSYEIQYLWSKEIIGIK